MPGGSAYANGHGQEAAFRLKLHPILLAQINIRLCRLEVGLNRECCGPALVADEGSAENDLVRRVLKQREQPTCIYSHHVRIGRFQKHEVVELKPVDASIGGIELEAACK
eukprot:6203361-Pleurochrysis_carterae.AAC.1